MTDQPEARCSGCGQSIKWRFTPAGKRMPLDAAPHAVIVPGTYIVESLARCRPADALFDMGKIVHMNHWATCKDAELFRRSPKGQQRQKGTMR